MSRSVAVVTDSTASLPEHVVAARSIIVVPLQVVVGAEVYDEGSDETQRVVTEALRVRTAVSTSRPAPETFAAAYQAAAAFRTAAVEDSRLIVCAALEPGEGFAPRSYEARVP